MFSVKIDNLNKTYGKNVILDNISLTMEPGGFTVLLGPSGCGKSTLLRLIAGLEDVTSGKILIGDKDVTLDDPKDRDIAMVFQSYALFPHMTVAENIGFGMKLNHKPKNEISKVVKDVATMLKIDHLLERTPAQLSGGQRQRVAIGRALVRQPKVFLFDEPLSNLDAKLRTEMRMEIKKLHRKLDTTVVYVTHDQIEAMTLATKIVLLNAGHIQQIGTPYEIYNTPANVFVAKFVGAPQINLIEGIIKTVNGEKGIQTKSDFIPLPDYNFSSNASEDMRVLLGIRPEHVSVNSTSSKNIFSISSRVNAFEKTGSETIAEFMYNNTPLRAKLDANIDIRNEDEFTLYFDLSSVSVFDSATEDRV